MIDHQLLLGVLYGAIESNELGTTRQSVGSLCDQVQVTYELSFFICEIESFHYHFRNKPRKPPLPDFQAQGNSDSHNFTDIRGFSGHLL